MSEIALSSARVVSSADLAERGEEVIRTAREQGSVTVLDKCGKPAMTISFPDVSDPLAPDERR